MIRALSQDELADLVGGEQEAGCGAIETEKGCLPLRSLDVDVRLAGLTAATTVRQEFVNVFPEPLEATYVFPLPPRAAVTAFRMLAAGAEIRGRVAERARARRDYDAAVAEGRRAAIVEEERPDVFTLRVGNIPPRSIARVEFTLVAPVAIDSLEATYRFPLVVAPRYCPGVPLDGEPVGDGIAADTDLVPDASRLSPPILLPGLANPVRLAIRVHVGTAGTSARADAFGCSLPAEGSVDDDGSLVVTVVPEQRLDRDFILRWPVGADAAAVAAAQIEPDAARPAGLGDGARVDDAPGEGTFAVTVVPPTGTAAATPRDVVFVLDRSGSMGGWKMAAARRATARIVDSLTAQDRVAAIAFDTSVEHAGDTPGLEVASDRNRWRLLEWLAGVEPRGGTELAAALAAGLDLCAAAASPRPAGGPRERFLVLVTDGQVGDEERVLRTAARRLGGTRLFVVGIDNAINEGLLARLADTSGGLVELVESEDRLDEVMARIQARIASPLVTDLRIAGDGIEIVPDSIVPARLPDLVAGVPLVLRGRYRGGAPAARIRVEGRQASGAAWAATAPVAPAAAPGLASLWARGRLRHLEDEFARGGTRADGDSLERRIVALSTSFGVLCRFTAVVAIDGRRPDERISDLPPRRIVQPVDVVNCVMAYRVMASPAADACPPPPPFAVFACRDAAAFPAREALVDPFSRERGAAARLVATARPRSGSPADLSPAQVRALLRGVLRLVKRLGAKSAPPDLVERLVAAYARLYALPADAAARAMLLDALSAFVEEQGRVERWWTAAARGRR